MPEPPFPRGQEQSYEVVEVPLEQLHTWDENPRKILSERLSDLMLSLEEAPELQRVRPLVALRDGTVVLGNQRLRAGLRLGWKTMWVVFVDLDPVQVQLWALRDNNSYGVWDEPRLADLLAGLRADGVDLALTGFASRDLDAILSTLKSTHDPDDAPVPPPLRRPLSCPGEVYELGEHLLLCGDARDPKALARLVGDERAEVLWTDPPYGVAYEGKTAARLTIQNDDPEGLPDLLREVFAACNPVLAPSARFYVCAPAGPQGTVFRHALAEAGWRLHQSLAWVKQSPVLGHSDYLFQHEDILYGWTPGPGRPGRGRHQGSRWYGNNAQTTVFFVDRPARSADHPTQKPVDLIASQLRNSSRRGDVVLDPFAGSGSTLIACEQLGRRCFAVELDPAYCDVVRRRYREFTGDGR